MSIVKADNSSLGVSFNSAQTTQNSPSHSPRFNASASHTSLGPLACLPPSPLLQQQRCEPSHSFPIQSTIMTSVIEGTINAPQASLSIYDLDKIYSIAGEQDASVEKNFYENTGAMGEINQDAEDINFAINKFLSQESNTSENEEVKIFQGEGGDDQINQNYNILFDFQEKNNNFAQSVLSIGSHESDSFSMSANLQRSNTAPVDYFYTYPQPIEFSYPMSLSQEKSIYSLPENWLPSFQSKSLFPTDKIKTSYQYCSEKSKLSDGLLNLLKETLEKEILILRNKNMREEEIVQNISEKYKNAVPKYFRENSKAKDDIESMISMFNKEFDKLLKNIMNVSYIKQ